MYLRRVGAPIGAHWAVAGRGMSGQATIVTRSGYVAFAHLFLCDLQIIENDRNVVARTTCNH